MSECDNFEIAIEMAHRGALEGDRRRQLDAHLSQCTSCRVYQHATHKQEEAMITHEATFASSMDWGAFEERVRVRLDQHRKALPTMALFLVVFSSLLWALFGWHVFVGGVLLGAAILGVAALALRRAEAPFAAAQTKEDLLAAYRRELEDGLKRIRWLIPFYLTMSVFLVALGTVLLALGQLTTGLFWIASAVVFAATVVSLGLISRPRLQREQAELDRSVG